MFSLVDTYPDLQLFHFTLCLQVYKVENANRCRGQGKRERKFCHKKICC